MLAKTYNADYFPCKYIFYNISSTQESSVNPIFNSLISNIMNLIGDNMELQNLIGKNISVGKRIFNHPMFLQNLKENSYFKN